MNYDTEEEKRAFALSYTDLDICEMLGRLFGWSENEAYNIYLIHTKSGKGKQYAGSPTLF